MKALGKVVELVKVEELVMVELEEVLGKVVELGVESERVEASMAVVVLVMML